MPAVHHTGARLSAALAAFVLGAALTACGSDEPAADDDPTTGVTGESSAAPSEATDSPVPVDVDGEIAVAEFVKRLQAGIDKTKQAHIQFTMSGAGGEMAGSGDVDYTTDPPQMRMTMDLGPESLGMLLVDGTMYVKYSQAGKKYIAFDLSDPTNPLGAEFSEQLDPAASMKTFATAVTSVTSVGPEDVDGQSLERFELVVDTTKLADQASAAQLPAQMQVTVWLDSKDRMAKSVMNMGAITYDASLSDFDESVDIEAPPADQITQAPGS